MQISEAKQKNICLLLISGDIDIEEMDAFEDKLRELIQRGEKYVVLDFKSVNMAPMCVAKPLVQFGNSIRSMKGGVILRDLPESFR
ncbi:STAS domain-containing protein, partial [bacterium]|nr:STAS domain-containing protein [bacterium]